MMEGDTPKPSIKGPSNAPDFPYIVIPIDEMGEYCWAEGQKFSALGDAQQAIISVGYARAMIYEVSQYYQEVTTTKLMWSRK